MRKDNFYLGYSLNAGCTCAKCGKFHEEEDFEQGYEEGDINLSKEDIDFNIEDFIDFMEEARDWEYDDNIRALICPKCKENK